MDSKEVPDGTTQSDPVRSLGSNNNYARVQPRPDAGTVLARIGAWITDYNEYHPTVSSTCARRASSSVLRCNQHRVRFDRGNSSDTFQWGG
ncbi:MAG: hypothetical protein INR62_07980 [Rhodospirillales bacterium]|nr:hypothetical protein [Acetobacter sp.]